MSEKDIKQFRAILERQQQEVKTSKIAARDLLLKLGLLNGKGDLKKSFKSA